MSSKLADHLVECLLQPRVALDQSAHVLAVGAGVLGFLTKERLRLRRHLGIGDQWHRLLHCRHDHLLEGDRSMIEVAFIENENAGFCGFQTNGTSALSKSNFGRRTSRSVMPPPALITHHNDTCIMCNC